MWKTHLFAMATRELREATTILSDLIKYIHKDHKPALAINIHVPYEIVSGEVKFLHTFSLIQFRHTAGEMKFNAR